MIQATKLVEISKKEKRSRAIVSYDQIRTQKYQRVILPIKQRFKGQKDKIDRYLIEWKIMKWGIELNPCELIPFESDIGADVYIRYWNRLHFYKLPKDCIIQ